VSRAIGSGKAAADDAPIALQALRVACVRMADREACAAQLATAMSQAPPNAKTALVEILGTIGGTKALQAVAAAAKDKDPQLQDAASRLLGEWMTADAAPLLLDLANTAPEARHQVRALRGYIRIARQFVLPDAQRAEMCRAAIRAAKRDAEKSLVLEVLERYPSLDMLKIAVDAAKDPALKQPATHAALAIAKGLGTSNEVRSLLAQVGQGPVKIEIVKAEYGSETKSKDVTEALRQHVGELALVVLPSSYNASLGGDPAPGVPKRLKIQYKINNAPGEASFPENAAILLPMPKEGS
jgi:hypothetical protein